ncbi:hypothetical protein T492DRAFT_284680 [Pavlovales sp. CCMP2436]|nr:hypothetical protein T492DRAFT_284680 [Pavlovales sp. CCMP2436]
MAAKMPLSRGTDTTSCPYVLVPALPRPPRRLNQGAGSRVRTARCPQPPAPSAPRRPRRRAAAAPPPPVAGRSTARRAPRRAPWPRPPHPRARPEVVSSIYFGVKCVIGVIYKYVTAWDKYVIVAGGQVVRVCASAQARARECVSASLASV